MSRFLIIPSLQIWKDLEGHFIIGDISFNNSSVTIGNVYRPNTNHPSFLTAVPPFPLTPTAQYSTEPFQNSHKTINGYYKNLQYTCGNPQKQLNSSWVTLGLVIVGNYLLLRPTSRSKSAKMSIS